MTKQRLTQVKVKRIIEAFIQLVFFLRNMYFYLLPINIANEKVIFFI